jgi:hypothetical protein
MKPEQISVYLLSNGKPEAIILNRKMYKLEECDDEAMASMFNGGDRLPLMKGNSEGEISPLSGTL